MYKVSPLVEFLVNLSSCLLIPPTRKRFVIKLLVSDKNSRLPKKLGLIPFAGVSPFLVILMLLNK